MICCSSRTRIPYLALLALGFTASANAQSPALRVPSSKVKDLQWLNADDNRLRWLNVADWEAKTGGLQPVRMPKVWRGKIPDRSAERAMSTAGVALRLRTDSSHIAIRITLLDVPDVGNVSPESAWERARPPYFDVYRDGKFSGQRSGEDRLLLTRRDRLR